MFIRSKRLFLRPGWPEDWRELYELISDDAVMVNLARDPWPRSEAETRELICRPREKLLPHLFITLPTSNGTRLIGSIGLGRSGDDIELGYWIARPYWGQGYASEAVEAMLSLARAIGHKQLQAVHFSDNPTTLRVLEKAGFMPTGEERRRMSAGRNGDAPARVLEIALNCAGTGDTSGDGGDMRVA